MSRDMKDNRKRKKKKIPRAAVFFGVVLLIAVGLLIFIGYQITGDSVDIVDQDEVDPTADEVLI